MENMISKLKTYVATYPLISFIVGLLVVFLFTYGVTSFVNSLQHRSEKKKYEKQINELKKSLNEALIESEKHASKSKLFEEEAKALQILNDAKASKLIKSDEVLNERFVELENQRKIQNEQIESNYKAAISITTSMSDSERTVDICSRIKSLSITNPEFSKFKCPE